MLRIGVPTGIRTPVTAVKGRSNPLTNIALFSYIRDLGYLRLLSADCIYRLESRRSPGAKVTDFLS